MQDLYKLVYTSTRQLHCTEADILDILRTSHPNNEAAHITGILLQSKYRFIQYMEGARDVIYQLYERILNDPRHYDVQLRYFSPIEERIFPSWQMGYKDLDNQSLAFYGQVSLEDQRQFRQLMTGKLHNEEEGLRVLQLFFYLA